MPESLKFVQCKDCGNLAMIHPETGERMEAVQQVRNEGKYYFINPQGRPRSYSPQVLCRVKKKPLHETKCQEPNELLKFISLSFVCDGHCTYVPGTGPKELDEMEARQTAMDLQQKFLSLQQSVFDWRQQQAAAEEKFSMRLQALEQIRHNETIGIGKKQVRGSNWQAIASIVSAIAAVLALIISIIALCRTA